MSGEKADANGGHSVSVRDAVDRNHVVCVRVFAKRTHGEMLAVGIDSVGVMGYVVHYYDVVISGDLDQRQQLFFFLYRAEGVYGIADYYDFRFLGKQLFDFKRV